MPDNGAITPGKVEFKEYVNAIFAQQLKASDSTNEPMSFDQKSLEVLGGYILENNLIGTLGTRLPLSSVNMDTIVYLKSLGQTFTTKSKIGFNSAEKPRFAKVTVTWNEPLTSSVGFAQADFDRGLPNAIAMKADEAAKTYARLVEKEAWKQVEKHLSANATLSVETTNLLSEPDKEKLYSKIVNLGTELSLLQDDKDNIQGVSRDNIIIHVKPQVLDKLARLAQVGNAALQYFSGGQYAMAMIGGYKVVANEFLDQYDAIAATNFSVASAVHPIALNYAKLEPTNDYGLYTEIANAFKIVYESCFKAIKHRA